MALEEKEDVIEKKLDNVLRATEARIVTLIGELETKRGRILSTRINIRRALNMRAEILAAMRPYQRTAREVTNFSIAAKETQKRLKSVGLPSALTSIDKDIIEAFSNDTYIELRSLGNQYAADVSKKVYTGAIAGTPIEDVVADVRQALTGGQDRRGRPLSSHAKTITVTRFREVDATLMQQKAVNDAGITKFKYVGSLIKDSREFCKERVGKTFTLEEIEAWEDIEFQGKKAGDPFIVRGGWNCRHHLTPVVE